MGFVLLSDRQASVGVKKDPPVEIDAVVPSEEFRPTPLRRGNIRLRWPMPLLPSCGDRDPPRRSQ